MYTYEDIKLQNQQDAFSAMYLCIARSVTDLCGRRVGERILREACRRAGRASGLKQRERLRQAGVKTNLHTLYHCGRDFVEDPGSGARRSLMRKTARSGRSTPARWRTTGTAGTAGSWAAFTVRNTSTPGCWPTRRMWGS